MAANQYTEHQHGRPVVSFADWLGTSVLSVVRCTVHDAPALAVRNPQLPGGGMMVCLEEDEAQAVADALHQLVAEVASNAKP